MLQATDVRHYSGLSMFVTYTPRDFSDYVKRLLDHADRPVVADQRPDVTLGDHDDVRRPEWSRVVEGEHVLSLRHDLDLCSPGEDFVAVDVLALIRHSLRDAR